MADGNWHAKIGNGEVTGTVLLMRRPFSANFVE
jgi:hypothetical protein